MSLRPGKTKGPYVGPTAAAAVGDHKVLADGTDTTAEYLYPSLVAGSNITLTVVDKGAGNKAVEIKAAAAIDQLVKVSAADSTAQYLYDKVSLGPYLSKAITSSGGIEQLYLAAQDMYVKISAADTTPSYLDSKITAGTNITKTILNPGANETLSIAAADPKVKVSAADTTEEYLYDKVTLGPYLVKAITSAGGNEKLYITTQDMYVKVSAADTTPNYLSSKLVAGANVTLTILNPGANETYSIASAASALDYKFKTSAADTTANYSENKIIAGLGVTVTKENPAGNEDLKIALNVNSIASFRDDFYYYKPFWDGIPTVDSGRWSVDLVNHYLKCNSGTTVDEVRTQMEGDFDLQQKMYHPGTGATKTSINSDGDVVVASIEFNGTNITAKCTGKANTVVANANTTLWTRYVRTDGTKNLSMFFKVADADPWTLLVAYTDVDLGPETEFCLVGNTNSRLISFKVYDNTGSAAVGALQQKRVSVLTDQANIVLDATRGDTFSVTLAGNRTMTNPTSGERSQKIIIRVKQDGTGNRTLAWGGDYRFPSGVTPTLSTGANKTDYFGFMFNDLDSKWDCIADCYNL